MRYEFVADIEALVVDESHTTKPPSALIITKAGKYLRGHIIDHNVRMDSAGKVRGRIVLFTEGAKKDVDANDIGSLEKL